jgi:hypothetical protein
MDASTSSSKINQGFLLSLILVVGIGTINFGYAIGVFNNMQEDFLRVFDYK